MRAGSRALAAAAIAAVSLLGFVGSAVAATYTVTRTDDPIPGPCEPADCSLREALMAANGTTTVDDLVVLPASATPYLIQYEELSFSVTDETEIRGAGANVTVVKGDGKEIVFVVTAKATLSGLTITGGEGGVQNNGDLTLRGVSVEGNERPGGGGGGVQSNGPLRIESSFLGFNRAKDTSGGAIQANSPVTLLNSTIAWNSSQENGGINGNSAVTVTNSAVVYNTSSGLTGAGLNGSPLTIQNSIFAGNKNSAGTLNCFSFMAIVSLGGNVSDGATCDGAATDRPNVLPGLGSLALHGGTTPLYDLLPGSPAIDAAAQCPPLDQRGVARPQGAACDSGPYEFVPPPPPPAGDKEFFMRVGKKLRLRKNAIWVRLTCPASEASPPCRGRASVTHPPLIFKGNGLITPKLRPLWGKFSVPAGQTKAVPLRRPFGRASRLPEEPGKWRVPLRVLARDAAGNEWQFGKKRVPLISR